ncbi:hypothetical protein [Ktedonospora formicarum]|uniref:Uncharacterized protein n=1 Tax=Ktedonospora formicarum TaxID=2778364 RepID=A0A8J3I2G1_9CHLR|nr:hypothetical protein [Ktedonospora formicarum]GHO48842.1 hypothetical protein KSX_70050 [Ktedonospora formicarum]
MSVPSYKEFLRQQSSDEAYPPQGTSQFKTPLKAQFGTLREQSQRFPIQGSTPSQGTSQFKAPLKMQSGTLREQSQPYAAFGASPFDSASRYHVTNPSQPLVQQPETGSEQRGYYPPFEMPLSNAALLDSIPTMPLPRVQALSATDARNTYSAGDPLTHTRSVSTIHPHRISTDPYIDIPVPYSALEAPRPFSQLLRASNPSWQSALPRTEPVVGLASRRTTKAYVMMKVILMGGAGLFVGGIASFWLLRSPTYLVVTWAILIIVFSNLVSRELRSYYRLKATTQGMGGGQASPLSPAHEVDTGRHPVLKDISDTTGYLKALSLVSKPGYPAQNVPEKEYRV